MGGGRWEPSDWKAYTTVNAYDSKTTNEIFNKSNMDESLNPFNMKHRESRDSTDNPNSNAIIVGLDVTGSMGMLLDVIARKGINTLLSEIYSRKPVSDPHVLFMGIGDVYYDRAPLQVTQFEADIKLMEQIEKVYIERGGGGNDSESYAFTWYFAAMHTQIDCFEKRNKKGYIFTVGDECPMPELSAAHIEKFLGYAPQSKKSFTGEDLLHMVQRQYEVFHVIVDEGSFAMRHPKRVHDEWTNLLGQHVLHLADHTKLAELIVSTIQLREGCDKKTVIDSWDGSTSVIISNAVSSVTARNESGDISGLVTL